MYKVGIFLGSEPNNGGMFQYSLAVLKALSLINNKKYEVTAYYKDGMWQKYCTENGLASQQVSFSLFFEFLIKVNTLIPVFKSLVKKNNPLNVALYNKKTDLCIFPAQDVVSYLVDVPVLGTIHDLMHRYERRFPEVSAHGRYHMREQRFKNISANSKGILVDSEVGKKHVNESFHKALSQIYVLPYIAPDYVYENDLNLENAEEEILLNELPDKFIFYPSQFWKHKNHINLIRSINNLKQKCPDIKLVLVGSRKNEYNNVMKAIKELNLEDNVYILGYVSNKLMVSLYKKARALVMPTFFGPTNIPQLEAFELGCPVATSRIYGIPEQVGDAALLFDPASVEEITECIEKLWTDDAMCEKLIRRGKTHSLNWGQKQFGERLNSIILSVLQN